MTHSTTFHHAPAKAVIGADVAKKNVAVLDPLTGRVFTVANALKALSKALNPLIAAGCDLLICEATGGYERALLEAARALGLAVHRADAAKVKAFIASHGGRAKTDPIDARWLSVYGHERAAKLSRWSPPDPNREALAELERHRRDLVEQRVQAKNRLAAPGANAVKDLLKKEIVFFDRQIAVIEARAAAIMTACADLARAEAALRARPGYGPATARALLALMPELGAASPKEIASLAGLAPHACESGETKRRRAMVGGRDGLKPVLFMAALAAARHCPVLKPSYERLIAKGKPKRLALAAIARRLIVRANAIVRDAYAQCPQLT